MNRPHIDAEGRFQSDKYPTCPPDKFPLSFKDPTAQDLIWEYAQRRRRIDSELSDDAEHRLRELGFDPLAHNPFSGTPEPWWRWRWDRTVVVGRLTPYSSIMRWRRGWITLYRFASPAGDVMWWIYGPFNLGIGFAR